MRHLFVWLKKRRQRRRNNNLRSSTLEEEPDALGFDLPTIATTNMIATDILEEQGVHIETDNNDTTVVVSNRDDDHHHLPLLYSLAKSWAWQAVWFRCRTHPQEASAEYVDQRGDNALHWVAFGNPTTAVVSELLKACPALARKPNHEGFYPLHGKNVSLSFFFLCIIISL